MMWMEFECGTSFLPETPEARQDFFPLVSLKGLSDTRTNDKLFFVFFAEPRHEFHESTLSKLVQSRIRFVAIGVIRVWFFPARR
jgi:hypothetical protein